MLDLDSDDGATEDIAELQARARRYVNYALLLALAGALLFMVGGVILGPVSGLEALAMVFSVVACVGFIGLNKYNGGLASTWMPGIIGLCFTFFCRSGPFWALPIPAIPPARYLISAGSFRCFAFIALPMSVA
jgi:hypothetical protein